MIQGPSIQPFLSEEPQGPEVKSPGRWSPGQTLCSVVRPQGSRGWLRRPRLRASRRHEESHPEDRGQLPRLTGWEKKPEQPHPGRLAPEGCVL